MTDKAIGFVETRGFLGVAQATDAMNKAADVDFVRQEHIGSGFVTSMVGGEVDAVRSAVSAGKETAQTVGEVMHAAVIAQIHPQAEALCIDWKQPKSPLPGSPALGLIETQGYVPMVVASDAAAKNADVVLTNYFVIGSGYATVAIRGDVAAVSEAVSAGATAASQVGKLVSAHTIPRLHPQMESLFKLGGKADKPPSSERRALGFMETHGLATLIAASDAAAKAASVVFIQQTRIGSGIVSSIMQGEVAAVRTAVNAGRAEGEEVGKFLTTNVIPFPHQAVARTTGAA